MFSMMSVCHGVGDSPIGIWIMVHPRTPANKSLDQESNTYPTVLAWQVLVILFITDRHCVAKQGRLCFHRCLSFCPQFGRGCDQGGVV